MDFRFPIGTAVEIRLVDGSRRRPESPEDPDLVADLRAVADECVTGDALRYGVLSGAPELLERATIALAYDRRTGDPVAFNAMSWMDVVVSGRARRILHSGLLMVVPEFRCRGLCGSLSVFASIFAFVRNGLRPLWVTNVTQVPAAAGVFAGSVAEVHPAPGRTDPPSWEHVGVALEVMARHRRVFGVGEDAGFDPVRFVIRNAYTGGSDHLKKTWNEVARHRDPDVNRLCSDRLDYDRGDDLLQVGRLDLRVTARLGARLAGGVVVAMAAGWARWIRGRLGSAPTRPSIPATPAVPRDIGSEVAA